MSAQGRSLFAECPRDVLGTIAAASCGIDDVGAIARMRRVCRAWRCTDWHEAAQRFPKAVCLQLVRANTRCLFEECGYRWISTGRVIAEGCKIAAWLGPLDKDSQHKLTKKASSRNNLAFFEYFAHYPHQFEGLKEVVLTFLENSSADSAVVERFFDLYAITAADVRASMLLKNAITFERIAVLRLLAARGLTADDLTKAVIKRAINRDNLEVFRVFAQDYHFTLSHLRAGGNRALAYAARHCRANIVQYFATECGLGAEDAREADALHCAIAALQDYVQGCADETVSVLIRHYSLGSADVCAPNAHGMSALRAAVRANASTVLALFVAECKITAADVRAEDPAIIAEAAAAGVETFSALQALSDWSPAELRAGGNAVFRAAAVRGKAAVLKALARCGLTPADAREADVVWHAIVVGHAEVLATLADYFLATSEVPAGTVVRRPAEVPAGTVVRRPADEICANAQACRALETAAERGHADVFRVLASRFKLTRADIESVESGSEVLRTTVPIGISDDRRGSGVFKKAVIHARANVLEVLATDYGYNAADVRADNAWAFREAVLRDADVLELFARVYGLTGADARANNIALQLALKGWNSRVFKVLAVEYGLSGADLNEEMRAAIVAKLSSSSSRFQFNGAGLSNPRFLWDDRSSSNNSARGHFSSQQTLLQCLATAANASALSTQSAAQLNALLSALSAQLSVPNAPNEPNAPSGPNTPNAHSATQAVIMFHPFPVGPSYQPPRSSKRHANRHGSFRRSPRGP